MSRRYPARSRSVSRPYRIPSTRRLGQWVSQSSMLPCVITKISQSRCLSLLLAISSRVYLFFPPRGHEPPPALSAVAYQSPVTSNARMPLCTQSVHSFFFPPGPVRTAPSRFLNTIRFVWQPPAAHSDEHPRPQKSLLVRNAVLMISHRIISRARLYQIIQWLVWSLALCSDDGKQDPVLYGADYVGLIT